MIKVGKINTYKVRIYIIYIQKNKKNMKILAKNRKLAFDYEIIEKRNVGIVLSGHEVKSVKV